MLFNPRLTTNDGLIANELMAKHGMAYPEALSAVERLVAHIQSELDRDVRGASGIGQAVP